MTAMALVVSSEPPINLFTAAASSSAYLPRGSREVTTASRSNADPNAEPTGTMRATGTPFFSRTKDTP